MSLRCLLSDELSNVAMHVRKLVGTRHPLLKTARGLVYDGKYSLQTRGLIILLMSKAAGPSSQSHLAMADQIGGIYPSQRSLAEITEMIHTANLIHKGVVNLSDLDPALDGPVKDMEFGNKMAVLSGDFLLANACTGLAELNNTEVVEIISSAIGDLMEAEFTGLQDNNGDALLPDTVCFADWKKQTFLSLGSLLAKGCQAAMELASHSEDIKQLAFAYGENMTYAHQMYADLQPFVKPDKHIEQFCITSAPVIKYVEANGRSVLEDDRKQGHTVSSKKIVQYVRASQVIEECRSLVHEFETSATRAVSQFPMCEARTALVNMVQAAVRS
ncbi:all trans-polyprenyl-diphosphate synthase PDSS2-like [Gigantopelta aegis]|uniref:all trans-polyprenyl-diphosphate synthase PDSS2-like n=1 Tax=Gigantopelta aegis TaxID=1735272 RepID=UPI001B88CF4B|nr:all trans-polyprenyl-diphosphate synthase PDSS2-like [Gigantopelta aegis]